MQISIIGGGCSGVLVAMQLLRFVEAPCTITIIEPNVNLGQGLAYSTQCAAHVLNVVAQNMSADPDDKDDLLNWLAANNLDDNACGFIPRQTYAKYLNTRLNEQIIEAQIRGVEFKHIQEVALDLQRKDHAWLVHTEKQAIAADVVVLAIGVFLRPNHHNYYPNPWVVEISKFNPTAKIAIIGSGLSTVDMLLWLNDLKHTGKISVFARNGALPHAHELQGFQNKVTHTWPTNLKVRDLLREFRQVSAKYIRDGYTWQAVVDSLRPYTQQIWQYWSEEEKQRFTRHLRSKWDLHRHRIDPKVAQQILSLQQNKFFAHIPAQVLAIEPGEPVKIHYRDKRNSELTNAYYDYVLDCTGLLTDYTLAPSQLLQNLFSQKIITPGPLQRGIAAGLHGKLQNNLYTLGFPLHGQLWESIAVPELRVQAKNLAQAICRF